jgi:hypothetical protein
VWTRGPLKRSFYSRFKLAHSCQKNPNLHTNSLKKLLIMNKKFYNCVKKWHATAIFLTQNACKNKPLFLTLLDRFKNHIHILWTQTNLHFFWRTLKKSYLSSPRSQRFVGTTEPLPRVTSEGHLTSPRSTFKRNFKNHRHHLGNEHAVQATTDI